MNWEVDFINAISLMKEARFIIRHKNDGTVIRVVIDEIDVELMHEFNLIFVKEALKHEDDETSTFELLIEKYTKMQIWSKMH